MTSEIPCAARWVSSRGGVLNMTVTLDPDDARKLAAQMVDAADRPQPGHDKVIVTFDLAERPRALEAL